MAVNGCVHSRPAAKRDMVVEVEVVKPGLHILAGFAQATDPSGKELQSFHVTIGAAFVVESSPVLDFPWLAFVRRVFLHPRQDVAVAFALGEFGFQRFGCNASESKPVAVHWVVVFVFAGNAGQVGPAFVDDAREENVAAETHAWAARRALS